MSVIIPQVITEDSASGAQIIDGSLKFDSSKGQYLSRTPGSAGNRKTFTISLWRKGRNAAAIETILHAGPTLSGDSGYWDARINTTGEFKTTTGSSELSKTNAVYRDTGWYHIVIATDTTQADGSQHKIYVNGALQSLSVNVNRSNTDTAINQSGVLHHIGSRFYTGGSQDSYLDSYISQYYFIDGQALGPENFGFTDSLTNTWRPKKYTGTYGTNGFYLPMDGNSPIGEDKSGNGNDWTPVKFGGSNTIEKATGAFPILNTDGGGRVATVGVRTDANASDLVLALPLVGSSADVSNQINSGSTTKTLTANGNAAASITQSNFYGGSYVFDGSGDYIASTETDIGTFGTGDFTVEYWCRNDSTQPNPNYSPQVGNLADATPAGTWRIGTFASSGRLVLATHNGSAFTDYFFNSINYNDNVWHHFCVQRSSGTVTAYVDGVLIGTATVNVDFNASKPIQIGREGYSPTYYTGYIQDLRIYKGVAKYTSNFIPASTDLDILPDTPSGVAGGSALTKITDGAVVFDGSGDYLSLASTSDFGFGTGDFTVEFFAYYNGFSASYDYFFDFRLNGDASELRGALYPIGSSGQAIEYYLNGSGVINAGAFSGNKWYHIALVRNSSTTTLYVDGKSVGSFSDSNNYANAPLLIGQRKGQTGQSWYGQISNFHVVKGTALYTSNFTPPTRALTAVANTKLLCCQSTTSATAAAVAPGSITANGNAAATNFNPFTTDINTVRGQETGYATLNPLAKGTNVTVSNGNLDYTAPNSASSYGSVLSTIGMSSGKWYCEYVWTSGASNSHFGVATADINLNTWLANNAEGYSYYRDGRKFNNGGDSSYGVSYTYGDVIGAAFDADAGTLTFYKNNVSQGVAFTGLTNGPYFFGIGMGVAGQTATINFGQKPFKYAPPEGHKTLCLANLPRPTEAAVRPDKYVGIVTYTGTGATRTISGLGFSPNFTWIKQRSSTEPHVLSDSVRGSTKALYSNTAGNEETEGPSAYTSDGFTLGSGWYVNRSGSTYVAWCWKAGGGSGTGGEFWKDDVQYASAADAGLNGGSITPTGASVGTKQGFSIIGYTSNGTQGATISHGLTQKPDFAIFKNRDSTLGTNEVDWGVYHSAIGATQKLELNQNIAAASFSGPFNNTEPTSSVFTFGGNPGAFGHSYLTNGPSGDDFIMYCWHNVPGLQKFGIWSGNSSDNGPFVETGFRPAIILYKDITSTGYWNIRDSSRTTYNGATNELYPATTDTENTHSTNRPIDFLSNGFKIRSSNGAINDSARQYVYAAWAEAPTVNLYGGQANAR